MEEAPLAPVTMPSGPWRIHEDTSNQARPSQTQNQNLTGNQTRRSPEQDATGMQNVRSHVGDQAQSGTSVNIAGQPQRSQISVQTQTEQPQCQCQPRPQRQRQPRQNAVADGNNAIPRPAAAHMGRTLRLEFQYQNGWLICRVLDTRRELHLNVRFITVSTLAMRLFTWLSFVDFRLR